MRLWQLTLMEACVWSH